MALSKPAKSLIRIGFIPLLDAALPIVAKEKGFAADQGLDIELVRETSWANIRERIAIGHMEASHMLAPMPIAASLGLGPLDVPLIAPMALGVGGNAITVSNVLWDEMTGHGAVADGNAERNGYALRQAIAARAGRGEAPPTFGIVHPYSGHNYELRYWLSACGIDPERDASLVVVPPPFTADAMAGGHLDGFCVGEPWNSLAVGRGVGVIATTKAAIWRSSPEKVLGVRADWAAENEDVIFALIRSLVNAAQWCEAAENRTELAAILAGPEYLDQTPELLMRGLSGTLSWHCDLAGESIEDFLVFCRDAATFPWISQALWIYTQMVRWGQIQHTAAALRTVRGVYRPDLYRTALEGAGVVLPEASEKVEGAMPARIEIASENGVLKLGPDTFFDGRPFDPESIDDYLRTLNA